MVRSNEIYYSLLITHYYTPVMLSEAKHLSVSTDGEILHYVQNDIVSEWYVATKIITNYSLLITHLIVSPIKRSVTHQSYQGD